MRVIIMKKLTIVGIKILAIAINTAVYAVDDIFFYEISINNQGISIDNLSDLKGYIKNEDKELVLDLEGGFLAVNTDLKRGIIFSIRVDYVFGCFEIENMKFSTLEDTARCFFDRDTVNGEYNLGVNYFIQELMGICFGRYFDCGENIIIGVIGKHFRGRKLERQYYEGIIERED